MKKLLSRFAHFIKGYGLIAALRTTVNWFRILRITRKELDSKETFTYIYENNLWGSKESVSGYGSTLSQTINLRTVLPNLFEQYGIKTVLDGPCGDFNWMKSVVSETGIKYIGVDIVDDLIANNNRKSSASNVDFRVVDLLNEKLPKADILISRDFLFHLSNQDIIKFLQNFCNSQIPYILTTTYANNHDFYNLDIATGNYRDLDLLIDPWNFPRDYLLKINDYKEPEPPRYLCLWSLEQIAVVLDNLETS